MAFVNRGLEDFSVSRLKNKMPWGISVPGDEDHVVYVWFDALINYISTLGWGTSPHLLLSQEGEVTGFLSPGQGEGGVGLFKQFWINGTPTQYCGKDNTRFQAVMWQAMLMAAGLPNTYKIVVNGHITAEGGVKMSKSLGNVIDPQKISEEYGTDALRYFLLREVSSFEDSPFSLERFKEAYNANLANGLGNLVSRIMKMASNTKYELRSTSCEEMPQEYFDALNNFNLQTAIDLVWQKIGRADKKIQETQPFKLIKDDRMKAKGEKIIEELVNELNVISKLLAPFLPETSSEIKSLIKENKTPDKPLFARK
jgi:methionyl-tRNA synthetase